MPPADKDFNGAAQTTMVTNASGDRSYYRDGKRHRDDGPAIECADGRKYWYRDGVQMTDAEVATLLQEKAASEKAEVEKQVQASAGPLQRAIPAPKAIKF